MAQNPLVQLVGQNRAPNTIKLRKLYTDYKIEMDEQGKEAQTFEAWAKSNHKNMKILTQ